MTRPPALLILLHPSLCPVHRADRSLSVQWDSHGPDMFLSALCTVIMIPLQILECETSERKDPTIQCPKECEHDIIVCVRTRPRERETRGTQCRAPLGTHCCFSHNRALHLLVPLFLLLPMTGKDTYDMYMNIREPPRRNPPRRARRASQGAIDLRSDHIWQAIERHKVYLHSAPARLLLTSI